MFIAMFGFVVQVVLKAFFMLFEFRYDHQYIVLGTMVQTIYYFWWRRC